MKRRFILLCIIGLIYLAGNFILNRWTFDLYYGDPNGYYLHVVSFFVNQDVGDYDKTITSLQEVNPGSPDPREDVYGIRLTDKGRRYIKYTLGVPVMETPFFLMAHAYASLSSRFEANGWTRPYLLAIGLSAIFYVMWGFYLLIGVLEKYFSPKLTTLVVLAIALATNLFFHATYTTMAHGFLFFDYCLLIYLSDQFYRQPNWLKALAIGGGVGLIALTRVPEVLSVFIPLLWGVTNWKLFKDRLRFFTQHYSYLVQAAIGFLLVFSIQFLYWYYVSGRLFFNPYQGEGFNLLDPKIHKGWFDFANGWLIYTPIMGLALIGLFMLPKYFPKPLLAILAFFIPHVYIHYSYYVWTYFPGFGQRPMVETYPLLSFGLAAFFVFCYEKKWLKWLPVSAIVLFSLLNLFQTWQMREGLIWTERSNHAFYWETFGTLRPTLNSLRSYDTKSIQPDDADIVFVKNLLSENFEDTTRFSLSTQFKLGGQYSLYSSDKDMITLAEDISLGETSEGDWLKISIQSYMEGTNKIWNRDYCQSIVAEIFDEKGKKTKGQYLETIHSYWEYSFQYLDYGRGGSMGTGLFFYPGTEKKEGWMDLESLFV